MAKDEHDERQIRCRRLGHVVYFSYCRAPGRETPCPKIADCWFEKFDVAGFLRTHYTDDEINEILEPPKPKMATLVELIQQAQERAKRQEKEGGAGTAEGKGGRGK